VRWETAPLGRIAKFQGGGTPSKDIARYWTGNIPWVSPKDMKAREIGSSINMITKEAIENSAASLIPEGAILVVVRSGILARTIPIAMTTRELAVNQDIKAICPQKGLDGHFLLYYLQSSEQRVLQRVTRSATVHRLETGVLRDLEIPLPPLPEQRRIVAILDEAFAGLEAMRANAEKNLQNARELFESCLDELSQSQQGWAEKSVSQLVEDGALFKPFDGNHGEIHPKKTDYTTSGVPFVMASDLKDGRVDKAECKFISKELADTLRVGFARNGDVLISHKGTIGRTAIAEAEDYVMLTPQVTAYRVRNEQTLSNKFLRYFFMSPSFQKQMMKAAEGGATRAYIGITKQLELRVRLPSLDEQLEWVRRIESLEPESRKLRAIYELKLAAINELKHSILQKAFAGELTATEAVAA
jgi:type I restriction enzyme S subunit